MAEERLIRYILKYLEKGVSFEKIRRRLNNDGWEEEEIQEAVKVVKEELENPPRNLDDDSEDDEKFKFNHGRASMKKQTGAKSTESSQISTWKKRLIIILSLFVLLGIAVFAGILIFS